MSVRSRSRRSSRQARRPLLEDDVPFRHDDLRLRVGPDVSAVSRMSWYSTVTAPPSGPDLVDGLGEEALASPGAVRDAHLDDAPALGGPELDVEVRRARGNGRRTGRSRRRTARAAAPRQGSIAAGEDQRGGPRGGRAPVEWPRFRASSLARRLGPREAAPSPPRSPRRTRPAPARRGRRPAPSGLHVEHGQVGDDPVRRSAAR